MKISPIGKEFYFCTGVVVNNVDDLVNHIKNLSETEYNHHVSNERNDFYNWIYYCIDRKIGNKIKGYMQKEILLEKLSAKKSKQKTAVKTALKANKVAKKTSKKKK